MNIIPLPNYYENRYGTFTFKSKLSVYFSNEFPLTKKHFSNYFSKIIDLEIVGSDLSDICFLLNVELNVEGYIIDVTSEKIIIQARTDQGAFYAFTSLIQLINNNDNNYSIDSILIKDEPRFAFRSFMLDVARHFFKKEIVLKLIEVLSLHKINYLHLHLSDDQGFRLEIDKYPELVKIGSYREKTKQLGGKYKNIPHSGYFSKQDIREIVDYAKEHFIEVIPEIDLPGHSSAILASISNLSCFDKPFKVEDSFGIKKNSLCITKDETYDFVYSLLDEVIELFPSKYIHLGVDEVITNDFSKCDSCKLKLKELKSKKLLLTYFTNNLANFLREKGKIPIVWNDYVNSKTNYNVINQYWKPFTKKDVIKEANNGRKIINSSFFHLYLDYPYSMTPLSKTYRFEPILKGINYPDNVLGIEAPLWSEYVDDKSNLDYQIFPRLAAVSEVAWTNTHLKNYDNFIIRLKHFSKFYDKSLINYNKNATKELSFIKRIVKTLNWFNGKR